ncbi:alpha/beta fold hydrolase [Puteibacter caeruleilacunae]|nr:alpha/beta fold hydrolase [Puteibacter caeruleilacunae]
MKNTILIILLLAAFSANSQTIYEYERKINQPGNYNFKEIAFANSDDQITLSGTLITPNNDFSKLIIIVAGSGKDTRYTHPKLAEQLLQNNIAVYRFDERGIGKSEGKYSYCFGTLKNDLNCCISHLRNIQALKNKQIGIIGHSLGGIATIALSATHPNVDFYVQMGTPVNAGRSFSHRLHKEKIFEKEKRSVKEIRTLIDTFNYVIRTEKKVKAIKKQCNNLSKKLNFSTFYAQAYTKPQFIEMIQLDSELLYKNIDKPTLFIIGKNDGAIDVSYAVNRLNEFNNKLMTVKVLDKMDHYLTYRDSKWNSSKKSADREIDDVAMKAILQWIDEAI